MSEVPKSSRWPESRLLASGLDSDASFDESVLFGIAGLASKLGATDEERIEGMGPCSLDAHGRAAAGLTGLALGRAGSVGVVGEFSLRLVSRALLLLVALLRFRATDVLDRGRPTSAEGEVDF